MSSVSVVNYLRNSSEFAGPDTGFASDAVIFCQYGQLFLFPRNGIDGTYPGAETASFACELINIEPDQVCADKSGTALFDDMSQIFVAEISQCAQDGIRCGLPKPTV